jgi:hypothetical protein
LESLPRFHDLAQQRKVLRLVIEALGETNQAASVESFIGALLDLKIVSRADFDTILATYARLGFVEPAEMNARVWKRLSEDPVACSSFATYLRDARQLRAGLDFARKARDLGAPKDAASALIGSIWRLLPEGRLERALTSHAASRWSEVLEAFFDTDSPRLAGLPAYSLDADKVLALALVCRALHETGQESRLSEFLLELERHRPLKRKEARAFAMAIAKSADRDGVAQLYTTWCERFPDDAELALYRAAHLHACASYVDALEVARRALILGADEVRCRRLIVQSLRALGRPHEALRELAILHSGCGWSWEDQHLYDKLRDAVIPHGLREGRETGVNFLREAWAAFQQVSKGVGSFFGGGDPHIPHRQEVLNAAPKLIRTEQTHALLTHSELSESLTAFLRQRPYLSDAAVAGTVLSLSSLYWLSAIDTRVLDAITFSSAEHPTSLLGLQNVTDWFHTTDGEILAGHFHRLAGYVAEQQAALNLATGGFEVAYPETSAQAGWDLLVDGAPFQVKLSLEPALVYEHLDKYPDIPVIVNRELAEAFAESENVIVDPGLSYGEIHQATGETLAALDGTGLIDFDLPLLTITFSLLRHGGAFLGSKIDAATYRGRVFNDTLFRGGGGMLGAKAGLLAGAVVAGPLGAAAAAIIGSMFGATAGGTLADRRNLPQMCGTRDHAVEELGRFGEWFERVALTARLEAVKERERKVAEWALRARAEGFPCEVVGLYESIVRESRQRPEQVQDWMRRQLRGGAESRAHAGWHALSEAPYLAHPQLRRQLAPVQQSLERYQQFAQART